MCILFMFSVVETTTISVAAPLRCTTDDARTAESVVPTADSWNVLHDHYKRYSQCDDGAISEGFSESVTRLLSDDWQDISQLSVIIKSDPSFREFVIHHVDETVPAKRLSQIAENVDKQCLLSMRSFCSELKAAVTNSAK
jgi:hypothetical protein